MAPAFRAFRGRSLGGPERPLSAYERQAEAALVRRCCRRHLDAAAFALIEGYYTLPASRTLVARKEQAIRAAALRLAEQHFPSMAPSYVIDVARGWAGLQRQFDDAAWAQRLEKSRSRLKQVRYGRRSRQQPGVIHLLYQGLDSAHGALDHPMRAHGLVVSPGLDAANGTHLTTSF